MFKKIVCRTTLSLAMLLGALSLVSCSEEDNTVNEFENWRSRNETYFGQVYARAQAAISSGSKDWKIIRSYAKPTSISTDVNEFIVVEVLKEGEGAECPLFTDSVAIHYQGNLIPSVNFPSGYKFDSSWSGNYNLEAMTPYKATANGFIVGFTTAIQNMHAGDRWKVYIPSALGYGSSAQSSIPAYSVLVFDLTLQKFWHPSAN